MCLQNRYPGWVVSFPVRRRMARQRNHRRRSLRPGSFWMAGGHHMACSSARQTSRPRRVDGSTFVRAERRADCAADLRKGMWVPRDCTPPKGSCPGLGSCGARFLLQIGLDVEGFAKPLRVDTHRPHLQPPGAESACLLSLISLP